VTHQQDALFFSNHIYFSPTLLAPATMTMKSLTTTLLLLAIVTICSGSSNSNPVPSEIVHLPGHTVENDYRLSLPHAYINPNDLPESFYWGNVNGVSYLTKSLNQHLPQ
jgi:hypothetical protein